MKPSLKEQWIKSGRQWPENPPDELTAYVTGILSPPPNNNFSPTASSYTISLQESPIPLNARKSKDADEDSDED